ncbi:MAG: tetratricopeptide repeat protein [Gemmatimonadales bacterium]
MTKETMTWQERGPTLEAAGRFDEAAVTYQAALEAEPENPTLLFRLGRAMGRLGQRDLELALVGQAIARAPEVPEFHVALGDSLAICGHAQDAREAFEEALRLSGGNDEARARLADLALDDGDVATARALLEPKPDTPTADRPLGRLALTDERWEAATSHLLQHLTRQPIDAAGLFYLGVALQARDLLEPATAAYTQAVGVDPTLFEGHANLSTVLSALGRPAEALVHAERAAALAPSRPGVYLNRSNARRDLGDLAGALADLRHAVDLEPNYPEAWSSLGNLYHDLGELSQSLTAHQKAVELAPNLAQARWNRSFALLASGQLQSGWEEYECRLHTKAASPEPRDFPWPTWAGGPTAGRRILVYREQGLGDELLFLSCVPDLVARGAAVTLLVSPRLETMVRRAFPGVDVRADQIGALDRNEAFDAQIPIGSLPRWFRASRDAFPVSALRFEPDPARRAIWAERLAALGSGRKIGWCWRSGLLTTERRRHYAPLAAYEPLLRLPGTHWVNLQYDDCDAELAWVEAEWGVRVHRWPGVDLRNDLEGVLGLIAGLDAVVTPATAVSSLAAIVGCRTWQLDAGSDWTTLGESRSPWFPSVRLARRGSDLADWAGAVAEIQADLAG